MKKLLPLAVIFVSLCQFANGQTATFSYTGSTQTYTVPPCITSITVDVQGAQGGIGPVGLNSSQGQGGMGGRTQATIPVNGGDVLTIYVGGAGAPDVNNFASGGFNGGGNGMQETNYTFYGGGGGGGASDIRLNGTSLTDRIVVAGGGGGGGADGCTAFALYGGAGGGLVGGDGETGPICSCNPAGMGGTQIAGGLQGDWACTCNATAGSLGQGGNSNSSSCGGPTGGAGGGGGYYGGGGGGLGGGGGGSSYTIGTATGVVHTVGFRSGDGLVMITPNSVPGAGPISGTSDICENASGTYTITSLPSALTYTWSVPAGTVINSGQGTTSITITAGPTSGSISVVANYACGATPASSIALTINAAPVVNLGADVSACGAGPVILDAENAGSSYAWSSGGSSQTESISASGSVNVAVTDANGCVGRDTINVTIHPNPVVNLGADVIQCGDSVTLDAQNPGSTYAWSNSTAAQTITVYTSGNYYVDVMDVNGCVGSDTAMVTINPLPAVTGTALTTMACIADGAIPLTGTPAGGVWSGPGVTGSSFFPTTAGVGTHTVTYSYTDANNCSATSTVVITVNVCTGVAQQSFANGINMFPNPNNGTFTIAAQTTVGDLVIEITDMQGRVVYSSTEKNVQAGFTKQINLETGSAGLYLMRITSNGEQFTEKISVQK